MSTYQLRRRVAINGSSKLPTELLDTIISFVYGKAELLQLCQSSKLLRSMAECRLYQLYFALSELSKANTRDLLQHPRFEAMVNTISITLRRRPRSCRRKSPSGPPCDCDKSDKMLGSTLEGLLSLKVLRLDCHLCEVESQERHRWILTLKTRSLQEFGIFCTCSQKENMKKALEYFKAPCMESVTDMDHFFWYSSSYYEEDISSHSLDPTILPSLRHFQHRGQIYHHLLLRLLPFMRINASLGSITSINYKDLWSTQARLTHMAIQFNQDGPDPDAFFHAVVEDPAPFRNLQHIGTIRLVTSTCTDRCQELHVMLGQLTVLEQLVSFDAEFRSRTCVPCDEYVNIFEKGISKLVESFPKLCRVFLEKRYAESDVWVLSDGWKRKATDCRLEKYDLISTSELPRWEMEIHRQNAGGDIQQK